MSIVYDGDGNRVSEVVAGVTTNYLVDTVNPTGYEQVVDELQNGTVTRTYSYGLERIDQNWQLGTGNWQLNFYGYDGHGSVRQLTNAAGTVTDTYDYDAFGNLINSAGSTSNNYLFAGEQFDPALGLYYNRARYLNTTTGRFWTMDTFGGSSDDPVSLHKYLYTGDDPQNRTDPSGHDGDLIGTVGALYVYTTLTTLAVTLAAGVLAGVAAIVGLPNDKLAFLRKPSAAIWGVQASFDVNQLIPQTNQVTKGIHDGLSLVSGIGGIELLFPFSGNQLWPYYYFGGGVNLPFAVPAAGTPGSIAPFDAFGLKADATSYIGLAWNVDKQADYAGPFFCLSGTSILLRGYAGVPVRPDVTVCSSTDPKTQLPGAYSLTYTLNSTSPPRIGSSLTLYYTLPPITVSFP